MIATLNRFFERQSSGGIAVFSYFVVFLTGIADYLVDPEMTTAIMYLLPISLAAWYGTYFSALSLSILSAVIWAVAYTLSGGGYSGTPVLFLNTTVRLMFFSITAHLLFRLRETGRKLEEMAYVDSMTGVLNSGAFYRRAEEEIHRASRYGHPFSIAYLDLDNFKGINDTFGHLEGDEVLKAVARVMKSETRMVDVIARLGGDEFVILFPETGSGESDRAIEKIRSRLILEMQEHGWKVTFSIGILTCDRPPDEVREIVQAVDELMYTVKKRGKDGIARKDWGPKPPGVLGKAG